MHRYPLVAHFFCLWICISITSSGQELPDIRTVAADLSVPELQSGPPAAGVRVQATLPAWQETGVYHVLHLPTNWDARGDRLPVLVEWAGNGGYSNAYGDTCDGRPEGCKLGYGLSAGRDYIWLCLPYVNAAGDALALKWWGDAPNYDPQPTLAYCRTAIDLVCREYHGDPAKVVLCGFSRGAIACNYLGLHDEPTADLWCGFLAYSHYDGVRNWPFPDSDRAAARARLQRLAQRPQLICSEGNGTAATREYLNSPELSGLVDMHKMTFVDTGFRNHNDAWILRPSAAREVARRWVRETVGNIPRVPAELLDLTAWKLTLPYDTQRAGSPDEVRQPELSTFADPNCFYLSSAADAVIFRATCGGPTTDNSTYPRSELRQMAPNGQRQVAWDTQDPVRHSLQIEQAILALPAKKPHVVCVQIHDADDDVLMIRLEKKKLFVERPGEDDVLLDSNYNLGERYHLRIEAGQGRVRLWYNQQLKLDWSVARGGCYFKVGCYTQSNVQRGDAPEAYGEVALYSLQLE